MGLAGGDPITRDVTIARLTLRVPDEEVMPMAGDDIAVISALVNEQRLGSGPITLGDDQSGGIELAGAEFVLQQNAPNPFSAERGTRITIELPDGASPLRLRIFDVLGRAVRTLNDGVLGRGTHDFTWRGRDDNGNALASGVYLAVAQWGAQTRRIRVILLR